MKITFFHDSIVFSRCISFLSLLAESIFSNCSESIIYRWLGKEYAKMLVSQVTYLGPQIGSERIEVKKKLKRRKSGYQRTHTRIGKWMTALWEWNKMDLNFIFDDLWEMMKLHHCSVSFSVTAPIYSLASDNWEPGDLVRGLVDNSVCLTCKL